MNIHTSINRASSSVPSIDDQKAYWNIRWDRTTSPNGYQFRRSREILSFLQSLELSSPRILDIGCGTGWFTAELNEIGESIGIDLSERAIEWAKSQYPNVTYLCKNLYESSFSDGFFDVVVAMEVIPHVEDQRRFIEIVGSTIKPGGYLMLSMVNKFAINRTKWDHGPDSHIIQWLSMRDLKKLLQADFRILKTKTLIPIGDKGVLRILNSGKLNKVLGAFFSEKTWISVRERLGSGYTRLVFAQKAL